MTLKWTMSEWNRTKFLFHPIFYPQNREKIGLIWILVKHLLEISRFFFILCTEFFVSNDLVFFLGWFMYECRTIFRWWLLLFPIHFDVTRIVISRINLDWNLVIHLVGTTTYCIPRINRDSNLVEMCYGML